MTTRPKRLLVVTTHAIQYFAPLYRELARRPGIDLTVAYATDLGMRETFDAQFGRNVKWDVPLTEGYRWVVMPEHAGAKAVPGPLHRRNWSVWRLVAEHDAVLLSSFLSVTDQIAAWSAVAHGKPILYRSETTSLTPRGVLGRSVRALALPFLLRRVAGAIYTGQQAKAYLRRYGVPDEKLHFGPYAVNNEYFEGQGRKRIGRRSEIQRAFGLDPGLPVILFSGKLIPKKQPLLLLEAFSRLQAAVPSQLLYVGDGILREEIERRVKERNILGVHLAGFLNQSQIADGYVASDVLVLPSAFEETWGLVMNEAMCFGLPVVASDRVGGAYDLVREGETGAMFPYRDVGELVDAMRKVLEPKEARRRLGDRARRLIAAYSIQASADGIEEALEASLLNRGSSSSSSSAAT